MGQAKARGTREERVAQAKERSERAREAHLERERERQETLAFNARVKREATPKREHGRFLVVDGADVAPSPQVTPSLRFGTALTMVVAMAGLCAVPTGRGRR